MAGFRPFPFAPLPSGRNTSGGPCDPGRMAAKKPKPSPSEALAPILGAGKEISVSELAEELIAEAGGAKSFAKLYIQEMRNGTKEGSVARARMLDGILKIVTSSSAQNKGQGKTEDQMSEEELQAVARTLLRKRTPAPAEEPADG